MISKYCDIQIILQQSLFCVLFFFLGHHWKISQVTDWEKIFEIYIIIEGLELRIYIHSSIDEQLNCFHVLATVSSVQLLSRVRLFATLWIAARQTSLSITNSRSSLRLMSIELVMQSINLILCRPLFLLPPIPTSIRVFSNESSLHIRWPKYWLSALASFLPKNTQGWCPLEWTGWISSQSKGLSRVFSDTTV